MLNLPWTTLQAGRQGAVRWMMPVAMLAFAAVLLSGLGLLISAWHPQVVSALQTDSLIDLTCTRRC